MFLSLSAIFPFHPSFILQLPLGRRRPATHIPARPGSSMKHSDRNLREILAEALRQAQDAIRSTRELIARSDDKAAEEARPSEAPAPEPEPAEVG